MALAYTVTFGTIFHVIMVMCDQDEPKLFVGVSSIFACIKGAYYDMFVCVDLFCSFTVMLVNMYMGICINLYELV